MILITGGQGQLGTELRYLLDEKAVEYVAAGSDQLDVTDRQRTYQFITQLKPAIIYHCAAYTAVDRAEGVDKELNEKINVEGTRNVAEAAKAAGSILVYISTDYVFDGMKDAGSYQVEELPNPINEYGRTSWVFGRFGDNFVSTMRNLAKTQTRLAVVEDQFGRPTWTRTLAEFMYFLIEQEAPFGVYQLSNENSCSWYEFAKEILKDSDVEIIPVASKDYPQKAARPRTSIMDLSKAKALGFEIPTWQEALSNFK
ncbi:sugar nucleotide-binding protein [Enterococcus avium]|uniref:SDR family oxidoreductase n=1 Tax=Enterococcus avium TaxID=33945 RepID=UPI00232F53B1|nr:sugar nucleotide-binding protein [Enterococcus avium]MDB1751437.1 sugar nucleotide-binding protein [Enterococcus avium]MDB1754122.1 sugar nucleotide-binding protein [Enterococcus avium]MDB1761251.1 sugar nucleotide-binding protein [Enterococcus avium]